MPEADAWNLAVDGLALKVERLATPTGLVVAQVAIESGAVSYKGENRTISLEKPAEFTAIVEEADLAAFVKSKTPEGIQIDRIELQPGAIFVQATVWVVISVSGEAECSLRIEDQSRLMVQVESVNVLGGSLKGMVQKQIDAMNPVLDVSELPIDVRLLGVEIEKGRIVLRGTLAPK